MSERTPWFVSGQKPMRPGVYQVRWWVLTWRKTIECTAYAYWSRRLGWCQFCTTPREALIRNHYACPVQNPHWRGITTPKA